MLAHALSTGRDYLTPTEDEAARRLLVTYCQLRRALLEMVFELRARGAQRPTEYDQLFPPGYAGTLVLLDAARFLRDRFHQIPWVRKKLNEPEPAFGIPGGVYDAIQESWTRPSRIWALFDAADYFQRARSRWTKGSDYAELQSMLAIIEQLQVRLHISWSDFARTRIRFRLRQFWNLLKRDIFLSAMFQIQKAAGILAADRYLKPGHQPGLPSSVQAELGERLRPGDVLLVRKEHALTNYFLPGYWPHSALYLGNVPTLLKQGLTTHPEVASRWSRFLECDSPERGRVMEAMKDGVHIRRLESPFRSDSILVLRPRLALSHIREAIVRAMLHEGKEYDFSFDFTVSNRLVCTEVIYRSYEGVGGLRFELSQRIGRWTLASEELVQMALAGQHFDVAATYIPNYKSRLLYDGHALQGVKEWEAARQGPSFSDGSLAG
jgi:hypothetical protein